jgi:hypothetical protein
VRGNSGRLSIEWRHNGATQPTPRSYTAENNRAGYRISDEKNVGDAAGTWEVRVRNGARQMVFRHEFRVQ